jgi:hypothetical protein
VFLQNLSSQPTKQYYSLRHVLGVGSVVEHIYFYFHSSYFENAPSDPRSILASRRRSPALALAASHRWTPMLQPRAGGRPPALGVGDLSRAGQHPHALRHRVSSPVAAAARSLLLPPLLELASSCAHVSGSRRPAPPGQLHLPPYRPRLHPVPVRHPS